jgi:hypothetical protein
MEHPDPDALLNTRPVLQGHDAAEDANTLDFDRASGIAARFGLSLRTDGYSGLAACCCPTSAQPRPQALIAPRQARCLATAAPEDDLSWC